LNKGKSRVSKTGGGKGVELETELEKEEITMKRDREEKKIENLQAHQERKKIHKKEEKNNGE